MTVRTLTSAEHTELQPAPHDDASADQHDDAEDDQGADEHGAPAGHGDAASTAHAP